jgi:CheY-like chemotaxis protein
MNNNLDFLEILDEFPSGILILKKNSNFDSNISMNYKNKTMNSNITNNPFSIYYSNIYISKIFPKTFYVDNSNLPNNFNTLSHLDIEENNKIMENFSIECSRFKLYNINKNNLSDITLNDDIFLNCENNITETYINDYYMIFVKIKKLNEYILINVNNHSEQKEMLNKKLIKSIEFDYFNTINHEIKNPINFLYNFDLDNLNYRTAIFLLKNCLKRFILINKIIFDKNLNNFIFNILNLKFLFLKVYNKFKLLFEYKKIEFNNNMKENNNNENENESDDESSDNIMNKDNNDENIFDYLNDFFLKCDQFYFKNLIKNIFYYLYLLLPEKSIICLNYKYDYDDNNKNSKKLKIIFYYEDFGFFNNMFKSHYPNKSILKIELNETVKSLDFSKNIIHDICEILNININFKNINDDNNKNNNTDTNSVKEKTIKNKIKKNNRKYIKKEILVMEINNVIYNKNGVLFDMKKYDFLKKEIDCSKIDSKIIKKLNNNIDFKFSKYIENIPSSNALETIKEINYENFDENSIDIKKYNYNSNNNNNNNINYLSTNDINNNSNNNLFNNNNYNDNNVIIVNYFSEQSNKNKNDNNTNNNIPKSLFSLKRNNSITISKKGSNRFLNNNNSNNSSSFMNNSIESRNHINNNLNFYKKINTINTFKNFGKLVNNLKEPILNNLKTQKNFDEKKLLNRIKKFNTVILKKQKLTKVHSFDINKVSVIKKLHNSNNFSNLNYNNNKYKNVFINRNHSNNKTNNNTNYNINNDINNKLDTMNNLTINVAGKKNSKMSLYHLNSRNKSKDNIISITEMKKKTCKNILVVDDEEYNQKTLKNLLKKTFKLSCDIDIAINGEDCLEKLKEKSYYLIFMDLYMPVMNGVEAMKNIQNSSEGKNYKIIVVSAHSYESVKNELKDINIINKFVQKPINKKKIEEILNEFYY